MQGTKLHIPLTCCSFEANTAATVSKPGGIEPSTSSDTGTMGWIETADDEGTTLATGF